MDNKNYDILIYQGDYIELHVEVEIPPDFITEGVTAEYKVSESRNKLDIDISKTSADAGNISVMESEGSLTFVIRLLGEDTNSLTRELYYHELCIIDSANRPYTVMQGRVSVKKTLISSSLVV